MGEAASQSYHLLRRLDKMEMISVKHNRLSINQSLAGVLNHRCLRSPQDYLPGPLPKFFGRRRFFSILHQAFDRLFGVSSKEEAFYQSLDLQTENEPATQVCLDCRREMAWLFEQYRSFREKLLAL